MTLTQVLLLGVLQGLTEFLPISSSGHLGLVQNLLNVTENVVTFDIVLHLGTLLAVLIFFRKKLLELLYTTAAALYKRKPAEIPSLVTYIAIGTVPAVVVGLFLKDYVDTVFVSLTFIGLGFLVTATILLVTDKYLAFHKPKNSMSWKDGLLVGLGQAFAIVPGISRSGSTVGIGIMRNLSREEAFNFSFLLAIPAIAGALILDIGNIVNISGAEAVNYLLGFTTAFLSGYAALGVFRKIILKNKLSLFGYYCLFLGIATLVFFD